MVVLSNFTPPTEGIKHEQPSTTLIMSGRAIGTGTLYIAENKLFWRNSATGEGISLHYPNIAVHAISRDIERFGNECLLIMVEPCMEEEPELDEELEAIDENPNGMTELRFVPEDKDQLEAMFIAMNSCQALHPDPVEQLLSEDDEYLDADEGHIGGGGDSGYIEDHPVPGMSSNGWRNHEEDMDAEGQFEDAEDED